MTRPENKTPGWMTATLWGATLAVALLAILLPLLSSSASQEKSGDIFTLPFLLMCIAGGVGGLCTTGLPSRKTHADGIARQGFWFTCSWWQRHWPCR